MAREIKDSISKAFGFEPIMINSSLVSAQSRKRLYWVGVRDGDSYSQVLISQPEERGITMQDVIENAIAERDKGHTITHISGNARDYFKMHHTNDVFKPVQVGIYPQICGKQTLSKQYRVYSTDNKGVTICGQGGGMGAKTGLYAIKGKKFEVKDRKITIGGRQYDIKLDDGWYEIRPLTVTETKRMQTVPDWYEFPCSDTRAYKMLGNGWTVEVIAHILREMTAEEQIKLL